MDNIRRKQAWAVVESAYAGSGPRLFFEAAGKSQVMSGRDLQRFVPRKRSPDDAADGEDWRLHVPSKLRETHAFFCVTAMEQPLEPPDRLVPALQEIYDFERAAPLYERTHLISPMAFMRTVLEINTGDSRYPRYPRTPMSLMKRIHTPLAAATRLAVGSAGLCDSLFAVLVDVDVVRHVCREVNLDWIKVLKTVRKHIVKFCLDSGTIREDNPRKHAVIHTNSLDSSVWDRFYFPFPGIVAVPCVSLLEYGSEIVDSVVVPLDLIELGVGHMLESDFT